MKNVMNKILLEDCVNKKTKNVQLSLWLNCEKQDVEVSSPSIKKTRIKKLAIGAAPYGKDCQIHKNYEHSDWQKYGTGLPMGGEQDLPEKCSVGYVISNLLDCHCVEIALVSGERVKQQILLELHFFEDYLALTALLGRQNAEVLADRLSAKYRRIKSRNYNRLPIVLTLKGVEYQVSVKPHDWSGLDQTAECLEDLSAGLNIKQDSDIKRLTRLSLAQKTNFEKLSESLGLNVKLEAVGCNGTGTIISKLLTAWVEKKAPSTPELVNLIEMTPHQIHH
uniref:Uncharacterized protein n=1 Tax=Caulerpa cliftonii TaxID=1004391 RepID=A0A1C9JBW2_9CHLO|nr:hypothetical protein [Caulerpa cliftonii]AOP19336.1 hypothetical protein [Caulerpa cliftonii]